MNKAKSIKYSSDAVFDDDLFLIEGNDVQGNLRASSIVVEGDLLVSKNLETKEGSIKVKGSLNVGNNVACAKLLKVRGNCSVQGIIQSKKIILDGKIDTSSIKADSKISIKGEININGDIESSEEINISVMKFKTYNIKGIISAPIVELRYHKIYSNLYEIPFKIYKLFGKKKKINREIIFRNLSITTNMLRVSSLFATDQIKYTFDSSCNIKAKKIEFYQFNPHPKTEMKLFSYEKGKIDDE